MQSVKGTSLQLTIDLVRERFGDAGVAKLTEHLHPDVRAALPPGLQALASVTYPFELWAEVLLAAEELFGHPRSFARESSRIGYRKLLQTTYANWVKHGQPVESIRRMPLLWEQVTKGLGTYEVTERGAELVVHVALAVPARYRTITEERVAGTLEAMLEASGAQARVTLVPFADYSECVIAFGPAPSGSGSMTAAQPAKKS